MAIFLIRYEKVSICPVCTDRSPARNHDVAVTSAAKNTSAPPKCTRSHRHVLPGSSRFRLQTQITPRDSAPQMYQSRNARRSTRLQGTGLSYMSCETYDSAADSSAMNVQIPTYSPTQNHRFLVLESCVILRASKFTSVQRGCR